MSFIKFVRIFLLVLIIIGIGLLVTQKIWVPKLVNKILSSEFTPVVLPIPENNIKNSDAVAKETVSSNSENCMGNNKYFVIEKNLTDRVGADHLVKFKTNNNHNFDCKYIVEKGDFEIKNEWAEYILGLENDYLILDSGTGADGRTLIIYNLITRKKIYEDSYSRPVNIKNNSIDYWTETKEVATEENCPKYKQWISEAGPDSAAIETHISLDISTLTKKDLGEHRCAYIE